MPRYLWLATILFLARGSLLLAAEQEKANITVEAVDNLSGENSYQDMETTICDAAKTLEQSVMETTPASQEVKAALDQERRQTSGIFKTQLLPLQGHRILSEQKRDISLTRWKSTQDIAGLRDVSVWDTPDFNIYLFEVDSELLDSTEAIRSFLRSIVLFSAPPLNIEHVYFSVLKNAKITGIVGLGPISYENAPSAGLVGYELYAVAYRTETKTYLCIRAGKHLVLDTDQRPSAPSKNASTRSDRIKTTETSDLLHELASNEIGSKEEEAIIHELVSRKLTDEEFNELGVSYSNNPCQSLSQ